MKKRNQIDEKFKWDLSPLCKSEKEFLERLENLKPYLEKFKAFIGKLNTKENIWKFLQLDYEFDMKAVPIALYIQLRGDEELSNDRINELNERLSQFFSDFSYQTSFLQTELHKLPDSLLNDILKDEKFKDYSRYFQSIKRHKKHNLSKEEEKLLSGMDFLDGYSSNMRNMSDVDFDYGQVTDSKGKKYTLTQSNFASFARSKDRKLRERAFKNLNGTFGKFINTLSSNYISEVKLNCYFAKIRNYTSALESSLHNEEIDGKVYDRLIEQVEANLNVLFSYFKIKKKLLNLKDFCIYDHMATLGKSEKKYTYDQAMALIESALSPLGEEYVSLLRRARNERWIDVYPNKDKRSGAYQTSFYGYNPYVLANFEGTLDDVFTLAHELGHAMHSYFSDKTQVYQKSDYPIFLAEIASTTNEMLLLNYLLKSSKSKDEKIALYNKLFDEVKGTIFRQTMFARFEEIVHATIEKKEPLTKDILCNIYYDLNKKYFGKVKLIPEIKYEWARIPHFFTAFYVYKYATGMICAINFASKILKGEEGAVENYYKFLSAGGSRPPLETLKIADCDLLDGDVFETSFAYLKENLKAWKALISK